MSLSIVLPFLLAVGVIFAVILAVLFLFKLFYVKVEQGEALIVNDLSQTPKVYFTGAMVWPVIHKKEVMRISVLTLEIDRRGKEGLICKDHIRADITVAFYIRVNETPEDVLKVAKSVGVARASNKEAVNELFNAKFSEALKSVGKQLEFVELFDNRIRFREEIVKTIGEDLNGYILEDVAIDYLEQTPIELLDPNNAMDAQGIRKLTELVKTQAEETNRLRNDQKLEIDRKDTATTEALLELEKQRAEAQARQQREIEVIRAREQAEAETVREQERRRAEEARIAAQEAIEIAEANKRRQVEVADKNRERAVVVEAENVEKARQLAAVTREREVELQRIEKEKALEEERKLIAVTISERIATEKKVAEEEERIKDTHVLSEAERLKQVKITEATAQAEEERIKAVKAAEAEEQKAAHKAQEIQVLAEAELQAADKRALAEAKRAEGIRAVKAADGLAAARVKEAMADALEREGLVEAEVTKAKAKAFEEEGMAEARVLEERMLAEAKGQREQGMAEAEIIKAKAKAIEEEGLVEARVLEEKLLAEAKGQREQGEAAAHTLLAKAKAEAQGLLEKFESMAQMSPEARDFEMMTRQLDAAIQETMASIEANKEIAKEQAEVLSSALQKAKIEIVGGQGEYFEQFAKGLSVGKGLEGVTRNASIQAALNRLLAIGGKESVVKTASSQLTGTTGTDG